MPGCVWLVMTVLAAITQYHYWEHGLWTIDCSTGADTRKLYLARNHQSLLDDNWTLTQVVSLVEMITSGHYSREINKVIIVWVKICKYLAGSDDNDDMLIIYCDDCDYALPCSLEMMEHTHQYSEVDNISIMKISLESLLIFGYWYLCVSLCLQ